MEHIESAGILHTAVDGRIRAAHAGMDRRRQSGTSNRAGTVPGFNTAGLPICRRIDMD